MTLSDERLREEATSAWAEPSFGRIETLPPEGEIGVVDIGPLALENGAVIDDVSIAVQRWGELSPNRDNVVMVLHALTGDSHITGPAGPGHPTPGWWDGIAGPGAPIDTNRWCAVATNVLGIIAFAVVLCLVLWGIDWVIRRVGRGTSAA